MCSVGYTSTSALFCAQTDVSHEKDRSARVNNSLCTRHVRSLVCLSTRLFAGGESTCESQDYRGGIIRMFSLKKVFCLLCGLHKHCIMYSHLLRPATPPSGKRLPVRHHFCSRTFTCGRRRCRVLSHFSMVRFVSFESALSSFPVVSPACLLRLSTTSSCLSYDNYFPLTSLTCLHGIPTGNVEIRKLVL